MGGVVRHARNLLDKIRRGNEYTIRIDQADGAVWLGDLRWHAAPFYQWLYASALAGKPAGEPPELMQAIMLAANREQAVREHLAPYSDLVSCFLEVDELVSSGRIVPIAREPVEEDLSG